MTGSPSAFFADVWEVVKLIPPGKVTNYGAIARYLGTTRSSRMVGYAMNASHTAETSIPAHRVVNRMGMLSGKNHFPTPTFMQEKLEEEGIRVQNDQVVDFKFHFWDPTIELAL